MKLLLMLCVLMCLAAVWVGVPPPRSEWSAKLEAPRMALELECGPASADTTKTEDWIAGSKREALPLQTHSARESGSPQPDWEQLGSLLAQGREYEAARLESEWLSREATAQAALSRLCSHPPLEDLAAYGCVRVVAASVAREPARMADALARLACVTPPAQQDLAQALASLRSSVTQAPLLDWSHLPRALSLVRTCALDPERFEALFVHIGECPVPRALEPLLLELALDASQPPALPASLRHSARAALLSSHPELYQPLLAEATGPE